MSSDWRWSKEGCWVSIPGNVLSWAVSATSCRSATFAGTRMPSKHWGGSGDVFGLWRVCHWWRVLPARGEEGRLPAPVLLASLGALGSIGVVDGRSMMLSRLASVDDDLRSGVRFEREDGAPSSQTDLGEVWILIWNGQLRSSGSFFVHFKVRWALWLVCFWLVGFAETFIFHGYLFTQKNVLGKKMKATDVRCFQAPLHPAAPTVASIIAHGQGRSPPPMGQPVIWHDSSGHSGQRGFRVELG